MNHSVGIWALITLCLAQWAQATTVYFPIVLTWANRTVAGVSRPVILTNGQYPGPPLQLNQNDYVQFQVTNFCPFSVTVHFHGESMHSITQISMSQTNHNFAGIEQIGTPWSDGVPGVSQVPYRGRSIFPISLESRPIRLILLPRPPPWPTRRWFIWSNLYQARLLGGKALPVDHNKCNAASGYASRRSVYLSTATLGLASSHVRADLGCGRGIWC